MSEREVRNDKTGATVTTTLSDLEACRVFAEAHGGTEHWLWFWLHKYAMQAKQSAGGNGQSNGSNGSQSSSLSFIGDSFMLAMGYGLVKPMIRAHYLGQRFKFYLSAKGTLCLKSGLLVPTDHKLDVQSGEMVPCAWGTDPAGDEYYIGCLLYGKYLPVRIRERDTMGNYRETGRVRQPNATESAFLANLAADPVGFLAKCSRDLNRCCYCNNPLEDARSKGVGYGKTCAAHWGLPWGDASYVEKAPSFAKIYGPEVQGLFKGIRDRPTNKVEWDILADWLEERGLPRVTMPKQAVTIPRS